MAGITNDPKGNKDYNMVLEAHMSMLEGASQATEEAHHQMESIMNMGMKFAGAMAGLLGGVMGSCGGGCGGI